MKLRLSMVGFLVSSALPCLAQTGVLDQTSHYPGGGQYSAIFEASWIGSFWQQQVRVGVTGQLEGFRVPISGAPNSHISWRIRLGDGWNHSTPDVFHALTLKSTIAPYELVFVDTMSANIHLTAGSTFTIEWEGQDEGGNMMGYYSPPPSAPAYPEPLFRGGIPDPSYRPGFDTFMIPGPIAPVEYCTSGTTTNGCSATIHAANGPDVSHVSPCTITVDGVEGQKSGIVFYGLKSIALPWCVTGGSSFLCVKPPTMRTATQSTGGNVGACNGTLALDWNAFQLATPGALGQPFVAGTKVFVQGWFRDAPSCKTTGLSNAIELTYHP